MFNLPHLHNMVAGTNCRSGMAFGPRDAAANTGARLRSGTAVAARPATA